MDTANFTKGEVVRVRFTSSKFLPAVAFQASLARLAILSTTFKYGNCRRREVEEGEVIVIDFN